jgi:hypothetical protein
LGIDYQSRVRSCASSHREQSPLPTLTMRVIDVDRRDAHSAIKAAKHCRGDDEIGRAPLGGEALFTGRTL